MEKGITVVGLGPGSAGHLSLETMAVLKSGIEKPGYLDTCT